MHGDLYIYLISLSYQVSLAVQFLNTLPANIFFPDETLLSFRSYSVKHPSIVVVDTLDSDHSCTHCFLREHLGLLDERTLRKDIDVQDPVCDEFYQTWVNSAKKNLDIYEEVSQSVCLSVCPFICDIYL